MSKKNREQYLVTRTQQATKATSKTHHQNNTTQREIEELIISLRRMYGVFFDLYRSLLLLLNKYG